MEVKHVEYFVKYLLNILCNPNHIKYSHFTCGEMESNEGGHMPEGAEQGSKQDLSGSNVLITNFLNWEEWV